MVTQHWNGWLSPVSSSPKEPIFITRIERTNRPWMKFQRIPSEIFWSNSSWYYYYLDYYYYFVKCPRYQLERLLDRFTHKTFSQKNGFKSLQRDNEALKIEDGFTRDRWTWCQYWVQEKKWEQRLKSWKCTHLILFLFLLCLLLSRVRLGNVLYIWMRFINDAQMKWGLYVTQFTKCMYKSKCDNFIIWTTGPHFVLNNIYNFSR